MGHVDHGKTSLLDAIRETEVAAGEAGGITQHIGAYQVHQDGKTISFIDTPGHAAFTAMRARGANVTDIAVIVVAADDGVMPQTVEAIDHAKAADVPMIVAVNKVDLPAANVDKVKGELANQGLNPEDWGGDTVFANVSAKTKEGLDDLLESILLVAELEELKANPEADASGVVVEAHLDPGRGPVATALVQRGTLSVGDAVVAGPVWGKVRAMQDHTGETLETAEPGDPVVVLGFDGVVEAGERFEVVENERRARQLAGEREQRLKTEKLARRQARHVSLEDVFAKAQEGQIKELNLLLKADVSGSLEALQDEIAKVPQQQVAINIIRAAAGGINESDVMLAAASDAIIIGFNVRPLAEARRTAESEGVEIRTYSVIYKVTEELRGAMEGLLEPEEVEESLGQAEVKELFKASRIGTIAGCIVTDGKITRDRRGPPRPRRHRRLDRQDRLAAPLQGQRPGGRGGPRVRHRARGLPGREGRRRDRGLREPPGRADARLGLEGGRQLTAGGTGLRPSCPNRHPCRAEPPGRPTAEPPHSYSCCSCLRIAGCGSEDGEEGPVPEPVEISAQRGCEGGENLFEVSPDEVAPGDSIALTIENPPGNLKELTYGLGRPGGGGHRGRLGRRLGRGGRKGSPGDRARPAPW